MVNDSEPGTDIASRSKQLLLLLVSTLILTALIFTVDYRAVSATIWTGDYVLILSNSIALLAILPFLFTLKWQTTLRILGYQVNFKTLLPLQLATFPISKLSPGNVGDLMKAYYLREHVPYQPHIGGIVFERMIDLMVLFGMSMIGGILTAHYTMAYVGGGLLATLILTMLLVRYFATSKSQYTVVQKLQRVLRIFSLCSQRQADFALLIGFSFLGWSLIFIYVYALFLAFDASVSTLTVFAIQPIAIAFGLLPITLAGIGTREAAMLALYAPLANGPTILAVGIVYSVFSSVLLSLAGLPFLPKGFNNLSSHRVKRTNHSSQSDHSSV